MTAALPPLPDASQDRPSLPQLLAQAAVLSAGLDARLGGVGAELLRQVADRVPAAPLPASSPDQMPDLPQLLEQAQSDIAKALGQLGALASGLGLALPAGAGQEDILGALAQAAQGARQQQLASQGVPASPAQPPGLPAGDPDISSLLEDSAAQCAQAQEALAEQFAAHGLDGAQPEAALAGLAPAPMATASPALEGLPGAEGLAGLQADAQRLGQLSDGLIAAILPA